MSERTSGSGEKRKLIIVEDDVDLRSMLSAHFEAIGWHVDAAGDGNEAIASAIKTRPDVIVLDLQMPVLDGWETMKLLRTYPATKNIPVVACTGASEESLTRATTLGCAAIARKPCSAQVIEVMINEAFDRGSSESQAG
jgi:CheY-like chemotaxis protein